MTTEIIFQQSAEAVALETRRAELREARARLTAREEVLDQVRLQLKAFETRYMEQVGVLYAELDGIEARITEREVDLYDSEAARARAEEARARAAASYEAAFGMDAAESPQDPPASLKALYREVAKRIHPDVARDTEEERYFHLLMARANQAYRRGDADPLQQLLDDARELHGASAGESREAEMLRLTRQVQHAERDLRRMEAEHAALMESEIAQLYREAEMAATEYRDLLAELAGRVRVQIEEAQVRFAHVDRQIRAHGR